MQRPVFREAEIQNHRDNQDRCSKDREENDRHNRDRYPRNVRVMPETIVTSRNLQVFSDLLFDPVLKIVARAARWGESGSGRKGCPG